MSSEYSRSRCDGTSGTGMFTSPHLLVSKVIAIARGVQLTYGGPGYYERVMDHGPTDVVVQIVL